MGSNIDKIKKETNINTIIQLIDNLFEEYKTTSLHIELFNALTSNIYLHSNQSALVDIIDYLVKTYKVDIHLNNNALLANACNVKLLELIDYILKSGPIDIDIWYTYLDRYYDHTLCHPDVLEVFIANNVNINFMNNHKLGFYIESDMIRIVEILLLNGYAIDLGLVNNLVRRQMLEVVKYILNSQPSTELFKTDHLILSAVSNTDTQMIQLLLSKGATIPWDKLLSLSKHTLELQQFLSQLGCTTDQIVAVLLHNQTYCNFSLRREQHQPSGLYYQ